ncbi:hypothetical protein SAY86_002995 [Trapa natans]|uniref:Uncharacterized protein n=1 Tax=Trapa natans TaxID=22666 RepID=A0AAN7LV22_TRANT|nr:hypothetical protein SAY86_002995 [Trapa natans]
MYNSPSEPSNHMSEEQEDEVPRASNSGGKAREHKDQLQRLAEKGCYLKAVSAMATRRGREGPEHNESVHICMVEEVCVCKDGKVRHEGCKEELLGSLDPEGIVVKEPELSKDPDP